MAMDCAIWQGMYGSGVGIGRGLFDLLSPQTPESVMEEPVHRTVVSVALLPNHGLTHGNHLERSVVLVWTHTRCRTRSSNAPTIQTYDDEDPRGATTGSERIFSQYMGSILRMEPSRDVEVSPLITWLWESIAVLKADLRSVVTRFFFVYQSSHTSIANSDILRRLAPPDPLST